MKEGRGRIRLTVAMTHPVQYYSPWFRFVTANCPLIDLHVIYAILPTAGQQAVGFGGEFQWDVSLLDGYSNEVVRSGTPRDRIGSESFGGLTVKGFGRAVIATRPDAVLVPGWYSRTLLVTILTCRLRGIPAIYWGDSQLRSARFPYRALYEARTRLLLSLFTTYLTSGKRNKEYLTHFGVPDSRTFSAPHAVDNEYFASEASLWNNAHARAWLREELGIPSDDFVVLFVGKLQPKKRPWHVVEAAAGLGKGVTVLFVGTGEEESRCREAAAAQGVNAIFAGFVNQSQIARYYALSDCLVLPSGAGETWGLVVNEALAAGVPCIVSDAVGCSPELVIEGKTGYTFPLGDIASLTNQLDKIRKRLAAGADFRSACRMHISAYSMAAAADGLRDAALAAAGGLRR